MIGMHVESLTPIKGIAGLARQRDAGKERLKAVNLIRCLVHMPVQICNKFTETRCEMKIVLQDQRKRCVALGHFLPDRQVTQQTASLSRTEMCKSHLFCISGLFRCKVGAFHSREARVRQSQL